MARLAVIGSGSWGTALAIQLSRLGHDVHLWARRGALVAEMRAGRVNPAYLPDCPFPPTLTPTGSLAEALDRAAYVVLAVPSHGMRAIVRAGGHLIPRDAIVVSATKGLETDSLSRMSEVIAAEIGDARPIVVLSGPSFAVELARARPTAVSVASVDADAAGRVQADFRGPAFRLYVTDDVTGVEMGGALKNVIAIAAGVNEALGLGPNALAALVTRGLAEMMRLACAVGARRESLAGLSGLGDLVLTCTGALSRNRSVGIQLGQGRRLPDILAEMRMVAEGIKTTGAALALGARHGVELPIAAQMAAVLEGRTDPRAAVQELMLRPPRTEVER
jgi:glycerol-3-phosphate dehydrogenase (NAD(P)+)